MYAIVEIAGQQFKVEEGKKIFVHRLEADEGSSVEFDKVLLTEVDDRIVVGEPVITDLVVEAKVLANVRGDKVIVFKKKKKKGYRVKNGHRQNFTQIEITRIGEKGATPKPVARKAVAKPAEPEVLTAEKAETEAKPAAKKTAAKKPAVKKEEAEAKPKKAAVVKEPAKKPAARKASKSKEKE
jgi:large subunit ribosomal protein L21